MTTQVALATESLTKSYGKVQALRGVDLQVMQGEIFGFLGPNGAGKTTTIRCLLDLIRPDGGTARVLGIDPQMDPVSVKERTGYLPGELSLSDNLSAERQLRYFSDLRGGRADWVFVHEMAERLDLDLKRPIRNLSKGNKQKVGVVQALMHRPPLLLLDEPTSGLDPLMQQEVLGLIREANGDGATVFLCSHIMSEVEAVTHRVSIIRQGRIAEVAATASLTQRALRRATVRLKSATDVSALADLPGVRILSTDHDRLVRLQVEGEMDEFIKALARFPISDLETVRPSLEEVFLAYYQADHHEMEGN